ncbi:hypothetical protein ACIRCZ_16745 [Leifsonia sp. NPDC102414]|uniref:hypothetical protein n=1 Tax=Leifsonia sp. NPDC102414 TaxID=3364124 RepID=UPI00382033E2
MIVASTASNAVFSLAVQLLGLVTLAPSAFGVFSLQYLVFALGVSVGLSTVSEPWLRTDLMKGHRSSWPDYSSALLYLSAATAVVTLVLSMIVPGLEVVAVTGAIAAGAGVYRSGARYHQVRTERWRLVLAADAIGVFVTVVVWAALFFATDLDRLLTLSLSWMIGGLAAAAVAQRPTLQRPRALVVWYRRHREHIVPLLKDSSLMDVGSIATPFAVAPLLGLADFGVYRAVSNVAAPVRLVLNPLRPVLAGAPLPTFRSVRRIVLVVALSIGFGAAAAVALLIIGSLDIELGSLTALTEYAIPTGLFVSANFLTLFYYMIARAHLSGNALLAGRIVQTVFAIVLPISGALAAQLSGAIWFYAVGTALSGVFWVIVVIRGRTSPAADLTSEDDLLP